MARRRLEVITAGSDVQVVVIKRALALEVRVSMTVILKGQIRRWREGPARAFQAVPRVRTCRIRKRSAGLDVHGVDVPVLLHGNGLAPATHLAHDGRRREVGMVIMLTCERLDLPQ